MSFKGCNYWQQGGL